MPMQKQLLNNSSLIIMFRASGFRNAIDRKLMFNLLHQETVVKIDCVVRKETEFQKTAFENRRKIKFGDFDV